MQEALQLASCIGVGTFIGVQIDRWLNSYPWGTFLFLLFGTAAGFRSLLRKG